MFDSYEPPLQTYFVKGKLTEVIEKLRLYFKNSDIFAGESYFFPDFTRDSKDEKNNDIKSIRTMHLAPSEKAAKGFAAAAVFGFNEIASILTYKSRPGEVHIVPAFVVDKRSYVVDENSLGEIGIKVSERIFM